MLNLLNVTIIDRFMEGTFLIGIALAILGVAISVLSARVCRAVRRTNDINPNDKLIITLKATGLILIFVAFIFIMLPPESINLF